MPTREISRDEWKTYFNDFNNAHEGEQATLREIGEDIGDQVHAEKRAFVGITTDDKGSESGSITILLGTEPSDNIEQVIARPAGVFVRDGEAFGHSADVEIRQEGGPSVIVELQRTPELSEA